MQAPATGRCAGVSASCRHLPAFLYCCCFQGFTGSSLDVAMEDRRVSAHASGQETRTHTASTPGGGVTSFASARSTGVGGPQQHETSVLHSTTGEGLTRRPVCGGGPAAPAERPTPRFRRPPEALHRPAAP